MSKPKLLDKTKTKQQQKVQDIPPALKVFSKTRDIESSNPYHLDGDMQIQQLSKDPDLIRQIQQIIKMYQLADGKILEYQYKRMQKKLAIALRPDIDQQQLEFVVDQDWKLDQTDGAILPQQMILKIYQLVDVWTLGVDKMEYITFVKLLAKKIRK